MLRIASTFAGLGAIHQWAVGAPRINFRHIDKRFRGLEHELVGPQTIIGGLMYGNVRCKTSVMIKDVIH